MPKYTCFTREGNKFQTRQYLQAILIGYMLTLIACKMPASPEKYFAAAALNANAVSHFGSDYFITALGYSKRRASTGTGANGYNYSQQINFAIQRVEGYLKNVNSLLSTPNTQALLNASKDLFQFTLESYRTDHLKIAEMIDNKASEEQVAKAMEALDKKSYDTFLVKYNKLYAIGIQYAKDNNIELMQMPKFNR